MFEYYIRPNMVHRADAACLRSKVDNMIGEHITRLQPKQLECHRTCAQLSV